MMLLKKFLAMMTTALSLSSNAATPPILNYTDYVPYGKRAAGAYNSLNGELAGIWVIAPDASGKINQVHFYDPKAGPGYYEEHTIKYNPATGSDWMFVTGYCNWKTKVCDTVLIEKVIVTFGGQSFDITRKDIAGQPYAPMRFSGEYEVKAWGWSAGARFFWHARVSEQSLTSKTWKGDGSLTRSALQQEEIWWDERSGWEGPKGTIGPDGWPVGDHPGWGRTSSAAQGGIFAWTGDILGWQFGTSSTWIWW